MYFIFILYLNFSTFAGNLGTKVEKEMKRTEKTDKILVKYRQYLKLEKSLSDNTVDAYLTDLDKLLAYLTLENINILDVRLEIWKISQPDYMISASTPVRRHASCQASALSTVSSLWKIIWNPTQQNYWNPPRQVSNCPK